MSGEHRKVIGEQKIQIFGVKLWKKGDLFLWNSTKFVAKFSSMC